MVVTTGCMMNMKNTLKMCVSTAVAETSELVFVFLHASIFSHVYNTALSF